MSEKMITQILSAVLDEMTSVELDELALDLQINDEPLSIFCDRFDLGNWFFDQMTLADVDIVSEVSVLADERRKSERELVEDERLIRQDLRSDSAL